MSFRFVATKSVASVVLATGLALPSLNAYLSDLLSRVADLKSRLTTYAQFATDFALPSVPASIGAAITALEAQLASIAAGMIPTIGTATVSVRAELAGIELTLAGLRTIVETFEGAASAGGVHVFAIDSTPAQLGGEVAAAISGGINGGLATARIQGGAFLTESPATFTTLSKFLAFT